MNSGALALYIALALAVAAGLLMALTRRILYAALALFFLLFCVAAVFALKGNDFLAVSQIVVYVGGILILLLFGIMLTGRNALVHLSPKTEIVNLVPGLLLAGGIIAGLAAVFQPSLTPKPHVNLSQDTIQPIGMRLLTTHLLVFELVSVVLLLALVGAAYLARRKPVYGRKVNLPASFRSAADKDESL